MKYDHTLLADFCKENNIVLLKDYSNERLNRDTKIEGKCISCDETFTKTFRQLYVSNGYCVTHTKTNSKLKYNQTCFKNYGVDNPLQNKEVREKVKQSCKSKYGVEHPLQNKEIREKVKQSCKTKYGVEHPLQNKEIREKVKQSCLNKYGVEYIFQSQEIKEKIKQSNKERYGFECCLQNLEVRKKSKKTFLQKYGVENPSQNEEIKNKKKQTCFKNYGVENPLQNEIIKNKSISTCLDKYGVEYYLQSNEKKQKSISTCLDKYGVEYNTQSITIHEKQIKNAYKLKDYKLPSGNMIKLQGYEHFAFEDLLQKENIPEEEIKNGCKNVPIIWYNDENGRRHRHFVDIFIPSQNRCIEVKSTWTAEKKKDNIFQKQKTAKENGYLYEIWVYNQKGERVECHV